MVFVRQFDGPLKKLARRLRARRIVRIVEHQHLHAIPRIGRHYIQVRQKTTFRQRRQQHLLSLAHNRHAMVRGIIRIGVCHGVTRRNKHGEQSRQTINRTLHGEQLRLPIHIHVIGIAIPRLRRLKKAWFAVKRRIAGIRRIVDGATGHVTDEVRRKSVRIAFRKIDHVGTAGNRRSHLAIHFGEHIRRNGLRDGGERDRRNI